MGGGGFGLGRRGLKERRGETDRSRREGYDLISMTFGFAWLNVKMACKPFHDVAEFDLAPPPEGATNILRGLFTKEERDSEIEEERIMTGGLIGGSIAALLGLLVFFWLQRQK